ncbi:MAG: peptidylprolyl isomerase [Rhizorhabdus sp.]
MLSALLLGAAAAAAAAAPPPPPPPPVEAWDPAEGDWVTIADDDLLVMTLKGGKRVVIRLAPAYAPEHVANIRKLARAGWWDRQSVYRVQENWVAQWGDATEKKPLPGGIIARPAAEFDIAAFSPAQTMAKSDAYSAVSGVSADGWAMATDRKAAWLAHCYGTVGVARDALPDTGTGAELFTPIGQSARRLDRNYTIVGRIIEGMEHLSALPRSSAPLGVYATLLERMPILTVRLASEIPAAERPHFQYRAADNIRFAAAIARKETPAAPTVGLGGADVCDIPLAVRTAPAP